MAEYIDKEKLLLRINKIYCKDCSRSEACCRSCWVDDTRLEIADAPTADVVEVVHGYWTGCDGDNCSVCGRSPSEIMDADSYYAIGFNINEFVACPYCGAKMNGKGDE